MSKQKQAIMKKWRYKQDAVGINCAICGEQISKSGDKNKGSLTIDHIIPKALGGTLRKDNVQPAHAKCNHRRQTLILKEFKHLTEQEEIIKRAIEIIDEGSKLDA